MTADIWIVVVLLLASGAVLVAIGRKQGSGTLDRNWLVGIRTSETMRSDAAWHAAHGETAGITVAAGVVPLVAGAATLVLRPADDATVAAIALVSVGAMLVLALIGAYRGHRIARDVNERDVRNDTKDDA